MTGKAHFFDVRVFNPFVLSYRNSFVALCYCKNELEKKRAYDQCVRKKSMDLSLRWHFLSQEAWVPQPQWSTRERIATLIATK